jgi:ERCC4-type nuclease
MEPITAAIVGSQALGGIMSFKGQRSAARVTRQVAEYNAKIAENEAILLARAKRDEEVNLRRQSDRLKATQRTATAASQIQMSGSPLLALADTYYSTESDAALLRYAGSIEQVQKASEATLSRVQGYARSQALKTQAYASLLGDVASTYSTYKAIG